MRRKMVAGNWKMHGTRSDVQALIDALKQTVFPNIDEVVFPSFVFLQEIENLLVDSKIAWGGQNLYLGKQGAFTGEVSGPMLVDFGCQYVLIGHSERRTVFQENLELIAAKFKNALEFGLQPVLCIGETLAERQNNQTENILTKQLESVIQSAGIESFRHAVLAYEPVWAIGTGLTATPEQAQEVHHFIRNQIAKYDLEVANSLRILYGGSVKADNAAGLFAMPDIDGALVGGASLDAKSFSAICEAAQCIN